MVMELQNAADIGPVEDPMDGETVDDQKICEPEETLSNQPEETPRPPLDPRVLAHVIESYSGDLAQLPDCDVPVYHGYGTLIFRSGFTYEGEFSRGRMHGDGKMSWRDSGVVYEGAFEHNEISGVGKFQWPNGSRYEGDVYKGKRHGRGVFLTGTRGIPKLDACSDASDTDPAGPLQFHPTLELDTGSMIIEGQSNARYEGEWADGLPHGNGVLDFDAARGVRYEGEFLGGQRHGRGTMHYANGNVYSGEWKTDTKCGHGTMTWMDAAGVAAFERYDGQWANDCQHGFGRHVWLVGSNSVASVAGVNPREKNWYEGEFREGVRSGRGVFYYANGARYEGEWLDNVKHGHGIFFYEDGRVFVGRFVQDRIVDSDNFAGSSDSSPSSQPASTLSVTSSGIILYIRDLFDTENDAFMVKAQKAVEHATLRINTELRTLYRQWIKEVRSKGAPESEDSGSVMEVFECRQLLASCGMYVSGGHLENLLHEIRCAQRTSALSDASSRGDLIPLELLSVDLPHDQQLLHPMDPVELEVVRSDQQLLYREFVELLVRITHRRISSSSATVESVTQSGATVLADAFSELFEQLMRGRQKSQRDAPSWLSQLRSQLLAKPMSITLEKHHALLFRLFQSCLDSSFAPIRPLDLDDETDNTTSRAPMGDVPRVAIRSILSVLRRETFGSNEPIFEESFTIRDALVALSQAFTDTLPPASDEEVEQTPDAFFADSLIVYSEFLDAVAIIVYAKHFGLAVDEAPVTTPEAELTPLFALIDKFLHGFN